MRPARTRLVRVVAVAAVVATAGCADRTPAAGEVSVTGVEVTQGIQLNNRVPSIPLIAHKRTYVRVYARAGGSDVAGVTATLVVRNEGETTPLVTLASAPITVSASGSDVRSLTDSFLFSVPDSITSPGLRIFTATLTLPNGQVQPTHSDGTDLLSLSTGMTFGPSGDPITANVWVVSYGITDIPQAVDDSLGWSGSTRAPRPISDIEVLHDITLNLLPISELTFHAPDWLRPDQVTPSFPCGATSVTDQSTGRVTWGCEGALVEARRWAERAIDAGFPSMPHGHPQIIAIIQPEQTGCYCGEELITAAGNIRLNLQVNGNTDTTLAHELAHGFGMGHTPDVRDHVETAYLRPDGSLGDYVGVQWAAVTTATGGTPMLVPGTDASGQPVAWDIMSYRSGPYWISPFTYCKTMANATAGAWVCAGGLDGYEPGR